jgi:hypothetical protein
MADFGAPVAQNVNVNPLQTISDLIGLRQKQQTLETGKALQATAQAQSVVAQQDARENQNIAALAADPVKNGLVDQFGNPTPNAQQIYMRAAPTHPQRFQDFMTASMGKIQYQNAYLGLTNEARATVSARLAGVANDPKATPESIQSGFDSLRADFKGTPTEPLIERMTGIAENAIGAVIQKHGIEGAKQVINGFSRGALNNSQITGPGGVATPGTGIINNGAANIPVSIAPPTAPTPGALTAQPGAIGNQLPPQLVTTPAGPIVQVGGGGGGPAGPRGPGGPIPAELNLTAAQKEAQVGSAAGVTQRVMQAQSQANNTVQAQDALSRAKTILEGPEAPNSGALFDRLRGIKNVLSSAGIDTEGATDANSLVKNLARYEAARATAAGLGATDAARELAHNGSPHVAIDNKALLGIVNQSLATEKALAAYAAKQSKTTDPNEMVRNENAFRNIPNLIQGYEYRMTRSPQEAEAMLRRHGISHAEILKTLKAIREFEAQ